MSKENEMSNPQQRKGPAAPRPALGRNSAPMNVRPIPAPSQSSMVPRGAEGNPYLPKPVTPQSQARSRGQQSMRPVSAPNNQKPISPRMNSQAGLASHRGGGVPMPASIPAPGEKGAPFNPTVRERKRELPLDGGPNMIRNVPEHLRPAEQPGDSQEEQSVASAAVKGFGVGFVGGVQANAQGVDPLVDRLGRQQEILGLMREDVELTREASQNVPEAEQGMWQNMLQRDELAADRMELSTNDYERDLVVQGRIPAREGLTTREYDLSRFGAERMAGAAPGQPTPAPTPAGQLPPAMPGAQAMVQSVAQPNAAAVNDRMRKFPELREAGPQADRSQSEGPQMG